jgi:hypothetical protein
MNDAQYILTAYAVVFGSMAVFVAVLLRRGRRLGRGVPEEDKPWT